MKRIYRNKKGQATVEFALLLPLMVFVLCLIIDFGWIFFQHISVNNTSKECARYASIHYEESGYQTEVLAIAQAGLTGVSPNVAISSTTETITAQVSIEVPILTGMASTFFGDDSLDLSASCTMRKEK